MDRAFSQGFPFEVGDLWRESRFLLDEEGGATLFPPLATTWPDVGIDVDLKREEKGTLFQEDFRLPELGGLEEGGLEDVESDVLSSIGQDATPQEPTGEDIWTLDLTLKGAQAEPLLRTWEAFSKKDVPNTAATAFLSEAGPGVFDAAAVRLEGRDPAAGVLPQHVLLRALCNLALGHSSLFFQWDVDKKVFVRTLTAPPMSGLSARVSDSLIQRILDFGTDVRILGDYSRERSSYKRTSIATYALKGCIGRILDCVDRYLTERLLRLRSVLELQVCVEVPGQLLGVLRAFVEVVDGLETDEEVISVLSDQVDWVIATQSSLAEVLRVLLARVSAPWLERLCVDVGLCEDRFHQQGETSQVDEDVDTKAVTGAHGDLPAFVDDEDRVLVRNCRESLRVLRQHLPGHEVAVADSHELKAFLNSDESNASQEDVSLFDSTSRAETLPWADEDAQYEYLNALDIRMSEPLHSTEQRIDLLQAKTDAVLEEPTTTSPSYVTVTDVSAFNPVARLRPLIQAHAKLINNTIIRHFFWTCRLKHHLDLQRQYHLFGNGDFVGRLSKALFSVETQSAERKRGTIPTGETMGLRLGTRDGQRWPPASSELRLTLAGVLTETYHLESQQRRDVKEVPGGLSFSIRELPDDEIERVLDSGSIYALDFLRLQYTPPGGLEAIITPSSMQIYDNIFRQLLRMFRVLDVATRLKEWSMVLHKSQSTNPSRIKPTADRFTVEAHHFISVLMSHCMDTGVEEPWKKFMADISKVEGTLRDDGRSPEIAVGLDGLRSLHERCLEGIRSRLFLRRKHEKIRNGIEDVFTAILNCAAAIENADFDDRYGQFTSNVSELLGHLRGVVNRPAKMTSDMESAENDVEGMTLLLRRLDWNHFYQRDRG